jgi:hypothetical protein
MYGIDAVVDNLYSRERQVEGLRHFLRHHPSRGRQTVAGVHVHETVHGIPARHSHVSPRPHEDGTAAAHGRSQEDKTLGTMGVDNIKALPAEVPPEPTDRARTGERVQGVETAFGMDGEPLP